ncbi:hypothetical protein ABZ942_40355 [Nocardia sp. NPDC046473]|uniref:hypothetical protein n=1 Tax=Nocardia sp. NPDC046473 TaxID=3155733 RepID=UPI0033D4C741
MSWAATAPTAWAADGGTITVDPKITWVVEEDEVAGWQITGTASCSGDGDGYVLAGNYYEHDGEIEGVRGEVSNKFACDDKPHAWKSRMTQGPYSKDKKFSKGKTKVAARVFDADKTPGATSGMVTVEVPPEPEPG